MQSLCHKSTDSLIEFLQLCINRLLSNIYPSLNHLRGLLIYRRAKRRWRRVLAVGPILSEAVQLARFLPDLPLCLMHGH